MAKDQKRRQKKLARKKAKRKQKRVIERSKVPVSLAAKMAVASSWPLHECHVLKDWQEQLFGNLIVSRRDPDGYITFVAFLLDFGCLGVKDIMIKWQVSDQAYAEHAGITSERQGERLDLSVHDAMKLVETARDYGEQLGFHQPRSYEHAIRMLRGGDPEQSALTVTCGRDGKPFYIAGPRDNADSIMRHLAENLGPDGFHYIAPLFDPDFDDES